MNKLMILFWILCILTGCKNSIKEKYEIKESFEINKFQANETFMYSVDKDWKTVNLYILNNGEKIFFKTIHSSGFRYQISEDGKIIIIYDSDKSEYLFINGLTGKAVYIGKLSDYFMMDYLGKYIFYLDENNTIPTFKLLNLENMTIEQKYTWKLKDYQKLVKNGYCYDFRIYRDQKIKSIFIIELNEMNAIIAKSIVNIQNNKLKTILDFTKGLPKETVWGEDIDEKQMGIDYYEK